LAAWPFLTLPKWSRTRSEQFDAVARTAAELAAAPPRSMIPEPPAVTLVRDATQA